MKYLVMECHPAYAVVLDEKGRFLKVANLNYEPGQTVSYALSSDYCGQLEIEILQVRLYDYLWIFGFSGTCGQKKLSVPVTPDNRKKHIG